MTETATLTALNLDYYNYAVIENFVFEVQKPVISGYEYEENGVYYCASATEKRVYRYSYALNNPLMYTDPTGQLFTKFLDKDGNLLLDVDDGSNAVFKLTGNDQTKDYFKFYGWDCDQGGVNNISMHGLIAGAQDYVMNYFTKCNQAVNFLGRTYNAALEGMGMSALGGDVVNGNSVANTIVSDFATSGAPVFDKGTQSHLAQQAAEAGALVIGTIKGATNGHVLSLTTGKFDMIRYYNNGVTGPFSYEKGRVANVNGTTTSGLGPNKSNSYDTRVKFAYADKFYVLYGFPVIIVRP